VNSTAAIVRVYQDITRRKEVGEEAPQEPKETHDVPATPAPAHNDWKLKLAHLLEQCVIASV
jgi:hypothetical protein